MSKEKQIEEIIKVLNSESIRWGCGDTTDKDIAEALYDANYRKQEWISVDERLPDREGKYLVCTTNGNIGVGDFIDYYGKGTHLCFACWAVTHWMPIPEPRR